MKTITIRQKRVKTFKDISIQCERISTMYLNGHGTDKMYEMVQDIYFKVVKANGGY